MDLGASLVKYCLCLFNFAFVIFGTGLIAIGTWLVADPTSFITLLKIASKDQIRVDEYGPATVIEQSGYVFIALGAFIFIISFLGYCGTMKESRFLLGAYAFFLTLIFALEIVVLVLFLVYRKETEMETRSFLVKSIHSMYSTREEATAFTVTFDAIMREGQCCGINNYTDFDGAKKFRKNSQPGDIPIACCQLEDDRSTFVPKDPACPRGDNVPTSNKIYGCLTKLLDAISSQMNYAIAIGVAIGLLQIIGIVFTLCVYKAAYYDYK